MKKLFLGAVLACAALGSDSPKDYDDRTTFASLEGTWVVQYVEINGQRQKEGDNVKLVFKGDVVTLHEKARPQVLKFRADPSRRPGHLDLQEGGVPGKDTTLPMIYVIEGDVLRIAFSSNFEGVRPTDFKTGPESNQRVIVLKREGR
jgi:uncharacterized protein (TIGR03067 family)